MAAGAPPELFDRRLRRLRRDRAAARFADHAFLIDWLDEELLARIDGVTRRFRQALVIGAFDGRLAAALRVRGMAAVDSDAGPRFAAAVGAPPCDEDRLPFASGSFDLVVSAGVLDQVADLPGALILIRRALRPDGLFLGAMTGAGGLPRLRAALLTADLAQGRAAARLHPQIDVRAAGDLLARAGFALPVADGAGLDVRYRGLAGLIADLRGSALTSVLADRAPALDRAAYAHAAAAFEDQADADGRVTERFEFVFLTGWAPAAGQPRPARRGSATQSLAAALRPPEPR